MANLKGRLDRLTLALTGPPGRAEAEAEFDAAMHDLDDTFRPDGSARTDAQRRAAFDRMGRARAALHGQAAADRYVEDLLRIYGPDQPQEIGAPS